MSFIADHFERKFLERLRHSRSEIVGLVEIATQVRLLPAFLLSEESPKINLT
jgi:hypothetical protein